MKAFINKISLILLMTAMAAGCGSSGGDGANVPMTGSSVTATKVDLAVTTALLTVYNVDWVAHFNTNGICGATDWVIDTAKEVVGTDCMPASRKDIMYIDDTVDPDLSYDALEEEKGGTLDAEGYPTVLDADSAAARLSAPTTPDMALLLDGMDDKAEALISVFPNTNTAQSFTVEAWIYPTPTTATVSYIATDDAYNLILIYDPTASNNGVGIVFTLYESDCSTFVTPVIEFRDVTFNQWNHVAAMFDASAQHYTISINGILSSSPLSFTAGTFCSDPAEQFSVGGFYLSDVDTFQGRIDEFRVSDNVRYTTDFTPLNSFIQDGNTKGLWHFDESPGSTSFSDSSGNGNTLTGLNGAQIIGPLTITGASGNQVALDGSWSAGCKLDEDGDMENDVTTISRSSFSITGSNWDDAGTCSGSPAMTTYISGTFTLGDEVTVQSN